MIKGLLPSQRTASVSHVIGDNDVYTAFENGRGYVYKKRKRTIQLLYAIVDEVTEFAA